MILYIVFYIMYKCISINRLGIHKNIIFKYEKHIFISDLS